MKKVIFFSIAFVSILALLNACKPDEKEEIDVRDKYVGEWHMIEESKSPIMQSYNIKISKVSDDNKSLEISNLGNVGDVNIKVNASLDDGKITVASQTLPNNWVIEGQGVMATQSNKTMNWQYTIIAGGNKITYNATATKL